MPDPDKTPPTFERLFFALWPDEPLRQQLAGRSKPIVQAADGRQVPAENLHITLAFLGNVDARQRECVDDMAEAITCPPFELMLDRVGHWARSRVLWLAPGSSPLIHRLAEALHMGASACGLSLDSRPYRPHLTLMRKVSCVPEALMVTPIYWPVSSFVLLRSVPLPRGVRYDVLREWPLLGIS